ncbi:type VII secretion-associated serine protease mycosin [Asanoa hainanensis]|uniref:Type VII secretion-associated serine protease mycosin n=1 Tax=Asanoa hainanensis TaxID=560556 RepID=A0A239KMN9_9ACTN|nr:S8 family serine peptidase [Asanoa hainanensis]SNT18434.1 type VII secretion-associated serine protease mycosin [Asanoa hainanensis]
MKIRLFAVAAAAVVCGAVAAPVPAVADEIRDRQWHLNFLQVRRAHAISDGTGTTVAVIDTGVEPHPDLSSNLLVGKAFGVAASGDGRRDEVGHGTGMAGIISAHGHGSDDGALGVAPGAHILPIIDSPDGAQGGARFTAQAIDWAVAQGADVINVSSHGGPSAELRIAIAAAIASDVVVVAGVGNRPGQNSIGFPAFYPGVVAVGATDRSGRLASLSVTGEGVTLTAPGVDIMTTRPGGRYSAGSGTSDSTAIVSGAAALVRSRFPDLSAAEVIRRLTLTATDAGAPGRDEEYGFGVINIVAALTADIPPLSPSTAAATPSATDIAAPPGGGGGAAGVVALVVGGGLIGGFVLIVLARRHRARRRPVP